VIFETSEITLQGGRALNQDRYAVLRDEGCVLLLLADGMGGHPRGEVAAQFVIDSGRQAWQTATKPISDPAAFLEQIVASAHAAVLQFGQAHSPPIAPRTTAVAVLVQNACAHWNHAGDSRFYLFRDYRVLRRTKDHSVVESLLERGVISQHGTQARRYRNLVTHCVGGSHSHFKTSSGQLSRLRPHDILLLCSDGLWSQIPDHELCARLRHHGSLERMVTDLARIAEQNAAPTSDNITLVALRCTVPEDSPTPTADDTENAGEQALHEAIVQLRTAIEDFESED
jgi:serine/threonine protein phosphatase PrpC